MPIRIRAILVSLLLPAGALAQSQPEVIHLWKDGAPGFESRRDEPETAKDWWVGNINNPSITVFSPPAGKANGCAVLIVPGGGFRALVFDREGKQAAEFLNTLGVTAFALKYRLPKAEHSPYTMDNVLEDAYRAMRLVRSRASDFHVDPNRIGILGFSVGGIIAMRVAFDPGAGDPQAADPIDRANGRPNFEVIIYPGAPPPARVPADSPPAFLLAANDDEYGCDKVALTLFQELRAANVPVEAFFLARGKHGFNMGERSPYSAVNHWPQRMADWLGDSGFLKSAAALAPAPH